MGTVQSLLGPWLGLDLELWLRSHRREGGLGLEDTLTLMGHEAEGSGEGNSKTNRAFHNNNHEGRLGRG